MNIGKGIRLTRLNKNMTQGELATAAGLSTTSINLIENGNQMPSPETVARIAKALGCFEDVLYVSGFEDITKHLLKVKNSNHEIKF